MGGMGGMGVGCVVDLGIVPDNKEELKRRLLEASNKCDIVISSGGVSMGAADFVKPLLRYRSVPNTVF
jgi:molybdopterin biosynthesis enzyme